MTSTLQHWPRILQAFGSVPSTVQPAIVVVHGIYSNHETFARFLNRFSEDETLTEFTLFYYDYDFHLSLEENGRLFADALASRFQPDDFVAIIAHSMGGLVSRLAILSKHLQFVRCLFLLGTPNLGAISTRQLSAIAQLVAGSVRSISALFPRKRGLSDLTQARDILWRYERQSWQADHIDYISIPGLYYHEQQPLTAGWGGVAMAFSAMRTLFHVAGKISPLFNIDLSTPHDGIVERRSNSLIPCEAGRESEKDDSINHQSTAPITYAHVEPRSCVNLTHIDIHSDKEVFETISEILVLSLKAHRAPGSHTSRLKSWYDGLPRQRRSGVKRPRALFGPTM